MSVNWERSRSAHPPARAGGPGSKGFGVRRRALEGAFFARQDQELIEGLRTKWRGDNLRQATGIEGADALALLMDEGIGTRTLVALLLAPVVEIAWADDRVTTLEKNTFHARLQEVGIQPSSPAGQILERWLEVGPPEGLMDVWLSYVAELERTMSAEAFAALGDQVDRMCRSEADSDGGVLRIGRRTSPQEKAILKSVQRALALI